MSEPRTPLGLGSLRPWGQLDATYRATLACALALLGTAADIAIPRPPTRPCTVLNVNVVRCPLGSTLAIVFSSVLDTAKSRHSTHTHLHNHTLPPPHEMHVLLKAHLASIRRGGATVYSTLLKYTPVLSSGFSLTAETPRWRHCTRVPCAG